MNKTIFSGDVIDQAALGAEVQQRLHNSSKPAAREIAVQLLQAASLHKRAISLLQVGACDGEPIVFLGGNQEEIPEIHESVLFHQ